jgi:hypothetical protein
MKNDFFQIPEGQNLKKKYFMIGLQNLKNTKKIEKTKKCV